MNQAQIIVLSVLGFFALHAVAPKLAELIVIALAVYVALDYLLPKDPPSWWGKD